MLAERRCDNDGGTRGYALTRRVYSFHASPAHMNRSLDRPLVFVVRSVVAVGNVVGSRAVEESEGTAPHAPAAVGRFGSETSGVVRIVLVVGRRGA